MASIHVTASKECSANGELLFRRQNTKLRLLRQTALSRPRIRRGNRLLMQINADDRTTRPAGDTERWSPRPASYVQQLLACTEP